MSMVRELAAVLLAVTLTTTGVSTRDEIRNQQWHLDFLNIDEAHKISQGTGVTVAVIDTGVDGNHPDLQGQVLPGADFSVLGRPDAWEDRAGHGTAMAGLIAANGRALGIAPGARVLPVRYTVYASESIDIGSADAVDWAVAQGATILCLAFSGDPDERLQAAVARAIDRDVVVVAALGNAPGERLQYPAAYDGVIGVAGVDRDGQRASVSIESTAAVLAAPAVDIMTTRPIAVVPSGYGAGSGTSDATAIVAGVAALVRAKFPELSAQDVVRRMTATAQDRGRQGRDDEYGYGIVNPVAALIADMSPLVPTQTAPRDVGEHQHVVRIVAIGACVVVLLFACLIVGLRRRIQ